MFLTDQIVTYLGNKRSLLYFIAEGVNYVKEKIGKDKLAIMDGFAGSGVVSRFFKQHASYLVVNDFELYAKIINETYLTNKEDVDWPYLQEKNKLLNEKKLRTDLGIGIIEKLYAPKNDDDIQRGERTFYTNTNAKIIDNIRRTIDEVVDQENQKKFFLAPLLYEASVHNNTSGVFKGFYKNKAGIGQFGGEGQNALQRIKGDIELPLPVFGEHSCEYKVYHQDTNLLNKQLYNEFDLVYYDPPYNQHPYGSNYFMLNLILSYKEPEKISEVAGIPEDWQKSKYNMRREATDVFCDLIRFCPSKYVMVSYNNEGMIPVDKIKSIMSDYGELTIMEKEYNTFRGSRNLRERNNKVIEYLYILRKF